MVNKKNNGGKNKVEFKNNEKKINRQNKDKQNNVNENKWKMKILN